MAEVALAGTFKVLADLTGADEVQCPYVFRGKTVTARCGMLAHHGGSHGKWEEA
jgi:hypothetical protein